MARAVTFADAAEAYIASHEAGWRNAHHHRQWTATLACASKVFGGKAVSAIDTEDVLAVLQPLCSTKTATASKLCGRIEMVLTCAAARGGRRSISIPPSGR